MNSPGKWIPILFLLLSAEGCSLLLDFSTTQCATNSDCASKGAGFSAGVCLQGTCVQDTVRSLSESGGSGAAVESTGGSSADGSGGRNTGTGGSSSTGGCVSNAQCVTDNLDEPYICRTPGEACLAVKTSECPLVFGNYRDPNAVYFGALLNLPPASPLSQMSTLNVQLAVDEFNNSVGGLPGGPLGRLRPLVAVVCRNEPALVPQTADHLLSKLGITATLAHLPSLDLKTYFVNYALPKSAFVINPGFSDNSLTSLSSNGLFWHVIGDIRDVAPAYVPLLKRVEQLSVVSGQSAPDALRVAMVVTKRFAEQSVADTLVPLLRFNNHSVVENGSLFFTTSVTAAADDPNADYSSANADLLAFKPHVVIALTRDEFVYKMLPALESGWSSAAGSQARPYYIVPTALSGNLDLMNYIAVNGDGATSENKRTRFVGVAAASAPDLALYDQFLVRFRTAYPRFENPGGFENFYDAVYLLGNAMFAAGSVPSLTGPDIARGIQRVVTGVTEVDAGPTHIADGFAALAAGGNIRLNGTMGLADFDPGLGARRGSGSVYCYQRTGGTLSIVYDVLRYDVNSGALVGEFPCFSGL